MQLWVWVKKFVKVRKLDVTEVSVLRYWILKAADLTSQDISNSQKHFEIYQGDFILSLDEFHIAAFGFVWKSPLWSQQKV